MFKVKKKTKISRPIITHQTREHPNEQIVRKRINWDLDRGKQEKRHAILMEELISLREIMSSVSDLRTRVTDVTQMLIEALSQFDKIYLDHEDKYRKTSSGSEDTIDAVLNSYLLQDQQRPTPRY